MIAVSVKKMLELEKKSINNLNIPSGFLMEDAAYGFVSALKSEIHDLCKKTITIVCGKGNNAGDGFAIARILHFLGCEVKVFPVFGTDLLKDDAKLNAKILKTMNVCFLKKFEKSDVVIDAIFGTGFLGDVPYDIKEVIDNINKSGAYIASVDIPSGLSAENGQGEVFIKADLCVTFGYTKAGHFIYPARGSYKKLLVVPISIPESDDEFTIITEEFFNKIPKRQANSHKGTFGKVLAFVGSYGMAGAALLSGTAILKSGAGMATIATPDTITDTIAHEFPSVMTLPLPTVSGKLDDRTSDLLLKKSEGMNSVLIGCGLGTSCDVKNAVMRFLKDIKVPTVIDADGLNILSENPDILYDKKTDFILTPHIAEFSRLSGLSVEEIKKNPIAAAKDFSKKFGITLILKDAVTIIAEKNGKTAISPCENSGLATAGSGDVLAGVASSLLAQGIAPFEAAALAVYVHSAAGKITKDTLGEYGMTSVDLLNSIPEAFIKPISITPFIKEM